jgi:phosphodiesterase/alkaline phosphatase D-like protein
MKVSNLLTWSEINLYFVVTTYGYFGTAASATYPNPLFIKVTKEIWKKYPEFIFIGVYIYFYKAAKQISSLGSSMGRWTEGEQCNHIRTHTIYI